MTSIPVPSGLTSAYTATYDAWNRLVSLTTGSTSVATYGYDGLNRRIVKGIYVSGTLDHKEHAYVNEKWQALEIRKEVSGTINSNPLEQYVWHPFYVDAPVLRDYDATTTGSPTRYYYTFDANYNVTAATNSSGSTAERYYYSPYGSVLFLSSSFTPLTTQQSQIGNSVTRLKGVRGESTDLPQLTPYLGILERLVQALPESLRFRLLEVRIENGRLYVVGRCGPKATRTGLRTACARPDWTWARRTRIAWRRRAWNSAFRLACRLRLPRNRRGGPPDVREPLDDCRGAGC
jgi:YD repeat-containing protein